jgi:hypothetical protein
MVDVEFESAVCTLRRNQCEEVIDVVGGRSGVSTGDFSNVREEAVKTFENVGGSVDGDVKKCAEGRVHEEVGEVLVNVEPLESIPVSGHHCNDKIWGSSCAWAE